jgi:hypothetical protein
MVLAPAAGAPILDLRIQARAADPREDRPREVPVADETRITDVAREIVLTQLSAGLSAADRIEREALARGETITGCEPLDLSELRAALRTHLESQLTQADRAEREALALGKTIPGCVPLDLDDLRKRLSDAARGA